MKMLSTLFNLLAPHNCLCCNDEGELLCDVCALDAFHPVVSSCFACSAQTKDFAVCSTCRHSVKVSHVWFATHYTNVAKKLIWSLKFEQKREAATIISGELSECLPYLDETVIVPVPTSPRRIRERGFDHTVHIAKKLARLRNMEYLSCIVRHGDSRQVGHTRRQRAEQVKGVFRITKPLDPKKRYLLIDDVVTTGATLNEATRVLKRAGATHVIAAVFARSLVR